MTIKFSHKCSRCGFCCLHEQCPRSIIKNGICTICPELSFTEDIASCALAGSEVPIGDGCCISARAYKDGEEYDFASLPPRLKILATQQLKEMKGV